MSNINSFVAAQSAELNSFVAAQSAELEMEKLRLNENGGGNGDTGCHDGEADAAPDAKSIAPDADARSIAGDARSVAGDVRSIAGDVRSVHGSIHGGDETDRRSVAGEQPAEPPTVDVERLRREAENAAQLHQQQQQQQAAGQAMQYSGDSFYSHFPSYANQSRQRERLANNRHQEYRDHLTKIAEKEATETKRRQQERQAYDDDHKDSAALTPDNPISGPYVPSPQLQSNGIQHHVPAGQAIDSREANNGLKHTSIGDAAAINPSIIKNASEEYAKEMSRRKLEYHRDLQKQIEDKKLEVKAMRAREKAEEEQMTKRLEEQLKSIQLEEELRRERKRSEQLRIASDQNHIYRMHLMAQLENDTAKRAGQHHQHRQPPPTDRPSERHRTTSQPWPGERELDANANTADDDNAADSFDPFDPRRAYKYFSNSARTEAPPSLHPSKSFQAFEKLNIASPATVGDAAAFDQHQHSHSVASTVASQSESYCKRCLGHLRSDASTNTPTADTTPPVVVRTVCQYCERRRHNLPICEDFCLKCEVRLATTAERQSGLCQPCRRTDLRCGFCQKHIDVCPQCGAVFCLRCHRRQTPSTDDSNAMPLPPPPPRPQPLKYATLASPPVPPRPPQRGGACNDERPIIVDAIRHAVEAAPVRPERRQPQQQLHQQRHTVKPTESRFSPESEDSGEPDIPLTIAAYLQPHSPPPQSPRTRKPPPFSTNVPSTSVFHPAASVAPPRLAVNIRNGQMFVDEQASRYTTNYDAFPVPLMPEEAKPASPNDQQERTKRTQMRPSATMRRLEQKWEVPAVQRNIIRTQRPPGGDGDATAPYHADHRVLTQLGAIRRQLQLEQMRVADDDL